MPFNRESAVNALQEKHRSVRCPYCNDTVTLNPTDGPVSWLSDLTYFIGLCPNSEKRRCKPIFAIHQDLNDRVIEVYPIASFEASWMSDSIPESIRKDYAEAKRCTYVQAFKGAVAMFRRVVEATACDKLGAEAKDEKGRTKKLWALIDAMQAKGLIINDLKETAHEIRHFGNYGAHVQDDGLNSVSSDEASAVEAITWQLLYTLYIAPATTAELRKKRTSKKATSRD